MEVLMLHAMYHCTFGKHDPVQYGAITLDEINTSLKKFRVESSAEID